MSQFSGQYARETPASSQTGAAPGVFAPGPGTSGDELNIAQWRLDIQTFVTETTRELESIFAQLSAETSVERSTEKHDVNALHEMTSAVQRQTELDATHSEFSRPQPTQSDDDASTNDRLAALKKRLARQIEQTSKPMASDEEFGARNNEDRRP